MHNNIGYIGLGIMGMPMATNLLKAGYKLHVWARNPSKVDSILKQGATLHASAAAVAANCDTVFLNVSATKDVEQIICADNGLLAKAHQNLLIVDNSTICPQQTRKIASFVKRAGASFADAPVSGGDIGAKAASLSIMVGASEQDFARLEPLLHVLGSNIVHVGKVGAGQACKACNQILVAQTITAVAETLLLAEKLGADKHKTRRALLGGFAQSKILELHGKRMLEQDFAPGFKAALHYKDMQIALNAAADLGLNLAGANNALANLQQLIATSGGELDTSAQYLNIVATSQTGKGK